MAVTAVLMVVGGLALVGSPPAGAAGEGSPEVQAIDSAADGMSCAITETDAVVCWLGGQADQAPADLGPVSRLAVGTGHGCAIITGDAVRCWGADGGGQATPPVGLTAKALAAGGVHSCAIGPDDTVTCWGDPTFNRTNAPTGTFTAIDAGAAQTCAIRTSGELACWGFGPTVPSGFGAYRAVSVGNQRVCAIRTTGTLRCLPSSGEPPTDLGEVSGVSVGTGHACAVVAPSGAAQCWGDDEAGQSSPPANLGPVTAVAASWRYTCAITAAGPVRCWGSDNDPRMTFLPPALLELPPSATVGVPFGGDDGTPPVATSTIPVTDVSVTEGELPPGLVLRPIEGSATAWELAGTPSTPGNYTFALTATNDVFRDSTRTSTVVIDPAPSTTTPLTVLPPSRTVGYGSPTPTLLPTYAGLPEGTVQPATPATCTTTASSVSPVGTYPVTCSGAADDRFGIGYGPAGTLTITKAATTLRVDALLINGFRVTLGPLSARLTRPGGDPVVGATVVFRRASAPVCSAVTNAAGTARCNASVIELLLLLAGGGVRATWSGDTNHLPASAGNGLIA